MAAFFGVEHFVREIAAEKKRLAPCFLHGKAQAGIVHIEANIHSAFANLPAQVIARALSRVGTTDQLILQIYLEMRGIKRTVKAVEKERYPRRTAFEECEANFRKFFKHTVKKNASSLDGDAERMAERVNRKISAEPIHAEMMQGTDVHRQGAAELFRLFVDRPINFGAEVILYTLAVGRQHAAKHAKLFDGAAQLGYRRFDILNRQQRHAFQARIVAGEFLIEPGVVGSARGDRPMLGDETAYGEAQRRIK